MTKGSICKGLCQIHPNKSKRMTSFTFNPSKDSKCQRCRTYFKDFSNFYCPCCGCRMSHRVRRKKKTLPNAIMCLFRDFWNFVYRKYFPKRKVPKRKKVRGKYKTKTDFKSRFCSQCGSENTLVKTIRKYIEWFNDGNGGFMCHKCYCKKAYRERRRKVYLASLMKTIS